MQAIVEAIIRWTTTVHKPVIIAISGHGASGKTTLAQLLMKRLGTTEINYINTDPYIISREIRRLTTLKYEYQGKVYQDTVSASHPAAHHTDSLERDILMIKRGLDLYTIDAHYSPEQLLNSKHAITIVEGMSAAFINSALFDLKIFLYTDESTELVRRKERDVKERGANINDLTETHARRRAQFETFMLPYSQSFDIIVYYDDGEFIIEKSNLPI